MPITESEMRKQIAKVNKRISRDALAIRRESESVVEVQTTSAKACQGQTNYCVGLVRRQDSPPQREVIKDRILNCQR